MDCLFCKIINGEIPCLKVYEDEYTFAFLDINPVNEGHTLVLPKKHIENLINSDSEDLKNIMPALREITEAVKKATNADGVNVTTNNGEAAGQSVFHLHFHIIPRFNDDGFKNWLQHSYKEGEDKKYLEKIKSLL